jgi:lipoyl(octanoyl) transferase
MPRPLETTNLGIVEYDDGLEIQESLRRKVLDQEIPDQLLLLEHPPVVTAGRNASRTNLLVSPEELERRGIGFRDTGRGGDVTFHGPGQIVGYPVMSLNPDRRDVVRYVRDLEEALIRALADFGVEAGCIAGLTGVWVGSKKIAAIGVRISRWVTTHGFAFNVRTDPRWFETIVPCGIQGCEVTNLESVTGETMDATLVRERLAVRLAEVFERELFFREISAQSVQVIVWRSAAGGPEILLLKRTPELGGFWQPVTGTIEAGESPLGAAVREAREETNLEGAIRDLHFMRDFELGREYSRHAGPHPWILREHAFAMQVTAGTVRISLEEHDEFRWVSAAEASLLFQWKGNRRALEILLSHSLPEQAREEISL